MSRLEELIQELCPDGVPFYSLGEVCDIRTGKGITKKDSSDEGRFPIISGGKDPMGFYYCANRKANTVTISRVGANAGFVNYIERDFYLNDKCFSVIPLEAYSRHINRKYLFLILKKSEKSIMEMQSEGGVPTINTQKLAGVCIPIPPLSVQEKLVCFLDDFTDKTKELQESLNGELQARKRQYEYYLEEIILSCHDYKKIKLEEICSVYDGTHQTPQYTQEGVKFVSVENIDNLYATKKFISVEAFQKYKIKPQPGDVLMTRITAGIIGKCTVVDRDEPLAYYVSLALLRPNNEVLDSRYLKYYIESGYGRKELKKYILADATPPKINKDAISKISILVPAINEQRRVVSLIESMNRVSEGVIAELSREIDARQKQYEYYRDKLLTFKERTI